MKKFVSGAIFGLVLALSFNVFSANNLIGHTVTNAFPLIIDGQRSPVDVINLDGTTFLPVRSAGEIFGYGVSFVDNQVVLDKQKTDNDDILQDFKLFTESLIKNLNKNGINVKDLSISTDQFGTYMRVDYPYTTQSSEKLKNDIIVISSMAYVLEYPIDSTFINLSVGQTISGVIVVPYNSTIQYVQKTITIDEYIDTWNINYYGEGSINLDNNNQTMTNNNSICASINDIYDKQIRQTEESLGGRGLGFSTNLTDAKKRIEKERKNQLEIYGCK